MIRLIETIIGSGCVIPNGSSSSSSSSASSARKNESWLIAIMLWEFVYITGKETSKTSEHYL